MNPHPDPHPDPHPHWDFFLDPHLHPHFFDVDPQHWVQVRHEDCRARTGAVFLAFKGMEYCIFLPNIPSWMGTTTKQCWKITCCSSIGAHTFCRMAMALPTTPLSSKRHFWLGRASRSLGGGLQPWPEHDRELLKPHEEHAEEEWPSHWSPIWRRLLRLWTQELPSITCGNLVIRCPAGFQWW